MVELAHGCSRGYGHQLIGGGPGGDTDEMFCKLSPHRHWCHSNALSHPFKRGGQDNICSKMPYWSQCYFPAGVLIRQWVWKCTFNSIWHFLVETWRAFWALQCNWSPLHAGWVKDWDRGLRSPRNPRSSLVTFFSVNSIAVLLDLPCGNVWVFWDFFSFCLHLFVVK